MDKEGFRKKMAEMFLASLTEKGIEWVKEWTGGGFVRPFNPVSHTVYRGVNCCNLALAKVADKRYADPRWVTWVQIADKEGKYHPGQTWHLQKGSKAEYVEYWYVYDKKNKKSLTFSEYDKVKKERDAEDFLLRTRYTAVFNGSCVDGMPELPPVEDFHSDAEPDVVIGTISDGLSVPILHDGGDRSYYSISEDCIHLPKVDAFKDSAGYNATALHELAHSTGAKHRLGRDLGHSFGSPEYAFEELVAEITSCFMGEYLAVEPDDRHLDNHKAYVQHWIEAISKDPEVLQKAIRLAEQATDYMAEAGHLKRTENPTKEEPEEQGVVA